MSVPEPHPGLVISYSYLWADAARQGQEEGVKNRPAAIVLVQQRIIGLDDTEPSWIVLTDVNDFV